MNFLKRIITFIFVSAVILLIYFSYHFYFRHLQEIKVLKQMVTRLEADSRIAEVFVTDVTFNTMLNKHMTTIKFLEYDTRGQPLEPRYFTFAGNIIQFQSLVVRFNDVYVAQGDLLRGKSVYLFWKVFILDGPRTQEYEITKIHEVPVGYKIEGGRNAVEEEVWRNFWSFVLDPAMAKGKGIKNAQIEAPGTKFVPGLLYALKIEHDGGIRIDTTNIPEVLKGEKILH